MQLFVKGLNNSTSLKPKSGCNMQTYSTAFVRLTAEVLSSERQNRPLRPQEWSKTPVRPQEWSKTPVRPQEWSKTPVRPQERSETPVRPQEWSKTPVRPQEWSKTPVRRQERSKTPVRPQEWSKTTVRPQEWSITKHTTAQYATQCSHYCAIPYMRNCSAKTILALLVNLNLCNYVSPKQKPPTNLSISLIDPSKRK